MYLGLNFYHDASLAWCTEKGLNYVEADRLLKKKHYSFTKDFWVDGGRLNRVYARYPARANLFYLNEWLVSRGIPLEGLLLGVLEYDAQEQLEAKKSFQDYGAHFGVDVRFYDHQRGHALEALWRNGFLGSGHEATVLTLDGCGDGLGAVFRWTGTELRELTRLTRYSFGELYEQFAAFFLNRGTYVIGLEGKFMAYAGLGKRVDLECPWRQLITRLAEHGVGWGNRQVIAEFLRSVSRDHEPVDVAYTVQQLWVDQVLQTITPYLDAKLPLVFAGGCALNGVLNYELIKLVPVGVYWSPTPGDCGQSIASLLQYRLEEGLPLPSPGDFYGHTRANPLVGLTGSERLPTPRVVAGWLAEGKVVAVCRGAIESGPRALGHRSILCSPLLDYKDRLNALKGREWYRPFGLVVPRDEAGSQLGLDYDAPWMNVVVPLDRTDLPAVTHVDGTTRVQTLTPEFDPWLHEVLVEFGRLTGVPMLLNTSLNTRGLPIFNDARDALALRGKVDEVVVASE